MRTPWESDHKLSEYGYASVMDYGARFNSDIHGLGKYDNAAIRFGYGQMIDLIPDADLNAWSGLKDHIALDDYTKLPFDTGGTTDLRPEGDRGGAVQRVHRHVDDRVPQYINSGGQGSIHVFPERPYKFCEDMFEGNLDCKTWDRGANQREIVNNVTEQFRNYYAFNAYRRGRTNWGIDGYLNRLAERYFNRYSEAFHVLLLPARTTWTSTSVTICSWRRSTR